MAWTHVHEMSDLFLVVLHITVGEVGKGELLVFSHQTINVQHVLNQPTNNLPHTPNPGVSEALHQISTMSG